MTKEQLPQDPYLIPAYQLDSTDDDQIDQQELDEATVVAKSKAKPARGYYDRRELGFQYAPEQRVPKVSSEIEPPQHQRFSQFSQQQFNQRETRPKAYSDI